MPSFRFMKEQNIGADLVAKALLNKESKTILVGGKPYFIKPPTIKQIAAVGLTLSGIGTGGTLEEVLSMMTDATKAATALSIFVVGDDSLTKKFEGATLNEVVNGLSEALSLIGIEDFLKLSDLSRSVRRLIANPK